MTEGFRPKQPVSVLVLVHTKEMEILLLERSFHPGFWQSVTGSHEDAEDLHATAVREVAEETGLDANAFTLRRWNICSRFAILDTWRHRYANGITHNLEHVFSLEIPSAVPVTIDPAEHCAWRWATWQNAAASVFSWSNRDAILLLAQERHLFP